MTLRRLRVALVSLYLPGDSKIGVGHQVHGLAQALAARGHDVTVLSPDHPGEGATYRWEPVPGGPPLRLVRVPWELRHVDWSRFDVVHAHGEDWLLPGPGRRPPLVRTVLGSGFSEARRVPGAKEKVRMAAIGAAEVVGTWRADATVAISEATRRVYPWIGRVIPCGVDVAAFTGASPDGGGLAGVGEGVGGLAGGPAATGRAASEVGATARGARGGDVAPETDGRRPRPEARSENPSILFVGTFANRKRGRLLWEAFAEHVRPAVPDAELWMVCDDAPPAAGVQVLGRVDQAELVRRYRSAWAFCLPSSYEGFGVPYAEALAAGTPVVATPNAGALEVLDGGRFGVLCEPEALGPALVELLGDEGRRAELAAAGRRRAARYDWAEVASAYEDVYAEVMARRDRRGSIGRGAATPGRAAAGRDGGVETSRSDPGAERLADGIAVLPPAGVASAGSGAGSTVPGRSHPSTGTPGVTSARSAPTPPGAPRRPAIFASSFHPHLGGVEELVRQLAHAQQAAELDPVVHTMRWPRSLPARERWEDLDVRRHSYRAPEGDLRRFTTAAVGNPLVLADVVRQLRADGADLVHVQCVSSGAWFAFQAARLLGLPFVATLQGELTMDADGIYERSPSLRHTLRTILGHADQVTACSAATLAEAEAWAGLRLGERGRVVHNGIAVPELERGAAAGALAGVTRPTIAALGRLVPQKGFDVLLDAVARAAGPLAGWTVALAGDGPEAEALRARTQALGIADRVRFLGRLDRDGVARLLGHSAVFVLPSRHEPFGIVNLEAMALGATVVASDVGGVAEIVDHDRNGVLVPGGDAPALAAALVALAGDPAQRARLAEAGRATAAAHDWARIEAQYREVYADAIDHHHARRRR